MVERNEEQREHWEILGLAAERAAGRTLSSAELLDMVRRATQPTVTTYEYESGVLDMEPPYDLTIDDAAAALDALGMWNDTVARLEREVHEASVEAERLERYLATAERRHRPEHCVERRSREYADVVSALDAKRDQLARMRLLARSFRTEPRFAFGTGRMGSRVCSLEFVGVHGWSGSFCRGSLIAEGSPEAAGDHRLPSPAATTLHL